jgi:hypothetical protein
VKLWDPSGGQLIKSVFIGSWMWSCRFFKLADVKENHVIILEEREDTQNIGKPQGLADEDFSQSSLGYVSSINDSLEFHDAIHQLDESTTNLENESIHSESGSSDLEEYGDFLSTQETPLTEIMVLASTKDSLIILDQNLTPIYILPHVVIYESGPTGLERLSFVEFLPENSCALIASQRGKIVVLNVWKTQNHRIYVSKEIEQTNDMILGLNVRVVDNSMMQICSIL